MAESRSTHDLSTSPRATSFSSEKAEKLTGVVERITFHNMDTGYVVLRVSVRGKQEPVTMVGFISTVVAGEYIEAFGQWVNDRQHGLQFKASELKTTPPHTPEGMIKYLGSGLIKGIGPKYAKRIVEVFGERTLEIIDQSPTSLSEVRGIGPQRLEKIRRSWQEQRGVRDVMVFLQSYGIGTARAVRIYKTYGDQSIELIKSNPYRLTQDIWGIGFKIADDLAKRLGLPEDSPLRARAAIRYVLQMFQEDLGHICYPEEGVISKTQELTNIPLDILRQAIETGRQEDEFVRDSAPKCSRNIPDELAPTLLYTKPMFLAELGVARSIKRLLKGDHPLPHTDTQRAISWVEERMGVELAPAQREALKAAMTHKLLVITGGPGVGKTTIVRGILEVFAAKGLRIGLAAPTGRAAKRLSESTGREAKTIHRLLEVDPTQGGKFKRDREHPLDLDLLVIDEVSMVDVILMNQMLRAVPPWCSLVLVGDVDQLPSVGPGAVLADLIASGVVPLVRLTQVFRQAHQSYIIRAAHSILAGEVPEAAMAPPGDFFFIEANDPETILQRLITVVKERLPLRYGFDPCKAIQVLAPMNKSELGVRNINLQLQQALNPPEKGRAQVERFGWTFRVGDKVLQTHNNYQKEVFNGDIGKIVGIDDQESEVLVEFEGRNVLYDFGELDELMLAYCTTIHKSQGSEYPAVVIPLHTQHYLMLQRNLLYTGITRGKQIVIVIGSRKAFEMAIRNQERAMRFSLLRERLVAVESHESTERV
ncbi:MAG: ATP-dependent RecD-like DNA helicase [Gemmataceae bacterium]|jgi:exodeoxyribonuclease V alpha subunit|nr:ATP-dependent RecD-like DNA helicase [Gemmataceae bacterium]